MLLFGTGTLCASGRKFWSNLDQASGSIQSFGFKVDMYSMKLLDGNSRVIADIKDDSSRIPYIARMKPLLATSADTKESGKCYVTMAIWQKRFGHQNIGYIEKMVKQELVKDLKCSDDDFKYCETCIEKRRY